MSARTTVDIEKPAVAWWVVLITGIAAIIVGFLLLVSPARTTGLLVQLLGIYWLVSGIVSLISIIRDQTHWGWKLFVGILGIIAGILVLQYPFWSALLVPTTIIIMLGVLGICAGFAQIFQAISGGGWGLGILGLLSVLLGVFLITRPLIAGLGLPIMLGILAIAGGILAIISAFSLRSMENEAQVRLAQAANAAPAGLSTASGVVGTTARTTGAAVAGTVGAAAVVQQAAGNTNRDVRTGVTAAQQATEDVVWDAKTGADQAVESVQQAGVEMTDKAAGLVESAGEALGDAGQAIGDTGMAAAGVAGLAAAGLAGVRDTGETVARATGDIVDETGDAVQEVGEQIGGAAIGVVGAGRELFEDTADRAGSVITGAVEQTEEILTGNVDRSDAQEMAKFRYRLEYVEGIGPVYAEKLKAIGIVTCLDLLRAGATRKGREIIVMRSGVSSNLILEWVNHVDLYRIKGVGSEYADLLEASGVDTVVELAQRNAVNLFDKLARVNLEKDLVRRLPTLGQVEDWVVQAKGLPRVISY